MKDGAPGIPPVRGNDEDRAKAAKHIKKVAKKEKWPDEDRDQVLGALGLK
jgi:hypothetical protein